MLCSSQGLLRSDSIPEVGEDAAATVSMAETLSEEERDELRKELAKVILLQIALKLVLIMRVWDNVIFEHTVSALHSECLKLALLCIAQIGRKGVKEKRTASSSDGELR